MAVLGQAFIEILPNTTGFATKLEKDVKSAVSKASASSGGAFNDLANVGQKALLGLGGAAISGAVLAVKLADTYEASHARLVNAFQNAGASIKDYSKQIAAADKQGEHFGLSQDQTEAALARLTQATNDPKKALADLGVAVNLAAARHIDLETAATIVGKVAQGNTTVLKRYGIDLGLTAGGVTQLNKAHDALAKATENLGLVEGKVGITHGNTAANASKLASAHDAVQKATLSLSNAQASLGKVESDIASGKLTGAAAAAAQTKANNAVAAATINLEAKQRAVADTEAKLGAVHGITAAQAAQLQKAHEAVAAATAKVSSVSGAAGQAIDALGTRFAGSAQAQAETFHGKLAALEAQGKDLGIHVGLVLIPIIERLASSFVKVLSYLEAHKPILIAIGVLIGTVLVAAITAYIAKLVLAGAKHVEQFAKMVQSTEKWAAKTIKSFIDSGRIQALYAQDGLKNAASSAEAWVKSTAKQIAALAESAAKTVATSATKVAAWAAEQAAALAAFIAENAAMLGIGVAIVALVAGIVWLVTHWHQAWEAIKEAAAAVWHFLRDDVFKPIMGIVTTVVDFIKDHWKLIAGILLAPLAPVLALWLIFPKQFDKIIGDIVGFFTGLPGRILDALKGLGSLVASAFGDAGSWLLSVGGDVIRGFYDGIKTVWSDEITGLLNIGSWLLDVLGDVGRWLYDVGGKVIRGLYNGLLFVWTSEIKGLLLIGSWIVTALGDAGKWLYELGGKVIHGLYDGLKFLWDSEITGLLDIKTWLVSLLGDASKWLYDPGGKVITGLKDGALDVWNSVVKGALDIKSWITTAFSDAKTWLLDVGGDIIRGLGDGMLRFVEDTIGKIPFVGGKIVKMFKDALGVKSPSTIMAAIGQNLMEGLALGISQGGGLPQSALDKLALTTPKVPAIGIPALTGAGNPAIPVAGGPGVPSLPGALAAHSDQLDQMNTLLEELTAFLKNHPPLVVKNDIHADSPQTTATQTVSQLRAAMFVAGR